MQYFSIHYNCTTIDVLLLIPTGKKEKRKSAMVIIGCMKEINDDPPTPRPNPPAVRNYIKMGKKALKMHLFGFETPKIKLICRGKKMNLKTGEEGSEIFL